MRELLVDTCTGEEEDGTAHSFQYYILVDEMELSGCLLYTSAPQHTLAGGTGDAPGPGLVGGESHLGQLWAGVDAGGDGGHSAEGGAAQQEVGHKAQMCIRDRSRPARPG